MTVDVSKFTPLIAPTPAVNEGVHYDNARRIEASVGRDRALSDITRQTIRQNSVSLQLSEQSARIPALPIGDTNTSAAPQVSPVTSNSSAGLVDILG